MRSKTARQARIFLWMSELCTDDNIRLIALLSKRLVMLLPDIHFQMK